MTRANDTNSLVDERALLAAWSKEGSMDFSVDGLLLGNVQIAISKMRKIIFAYEKAKKRADKR